MGFFDKLRGKSKLVQVTFINHETGQLIGTSEFPPDQLPADFGVPTTMHLQDQDWQVAQAEPATAAEFTRSGQLTLRLHKVAYLNPQEILYSLPTIADELPVGTELAPFPDFELALEAGDWRQIDFFPVAALPRIAPVAAAVQRIWQEHAGPADAAIQTFDQLHIRQHLDPPGLALDFARLQEALGTNRVGSLRFQNEPGYVAGGFVLETPAAYYYGLLTGATVTHLGVSNIAEDTLPEVLALNREFGLYCMVWYHAYLLDAEGEVDWSAALPA